VLPLHETLMDQLGRKISWMLLALSGFVLLIACANLANLQLARAAAGTRDLAIRASLGASRSRLILHQLNECVVLALAGGALGLWLAHGLNRLISRHLLIGGRAGLEIPIDGSILLIALAVSLLTGVVFGIVPAWLATRTDLNAALKSQTRGSTTGRGHHLLRRALVVAEVALALVLLAGAGIMQRGFARFLQHESGWDTAHVITASLGIPENRFESYPDRVEYFRRLETRLAALPGVEHAAIASSLPVHGYNGERPVLTEQQSAAEAAKLPTAFHVMVTSDYFATLGIAFVEGQSFPPDLKADGPQLIILNESLARQLWPNESAVGRRLASIDSGKVYWYEVRGVVRDVGNAAGLRPPSTRFTIYKPLCQEPWSWVALVLRARSPAALADSLRRAVAEVDPELPADGVGTVPQMIQQSQYNLRLAAKALAAFALLGLLLAAVGIYGVIASLVAQRTPEFGIRLALGAQPRAVQALVLGHGLRLTLVGLVVGLAGAAGLAWILSRLMPRLASPDPLALALVSLLLLAVALVACFVPAHRATKVDPLIALRAE
jgi:predicted permease